MSNWTKQPGEQGWYWMRWKKRQSRYFIYEMVWMHSGNFSTDPRVRWNSLWVDFSSYMSVQFQGPLKPQE